MMLNALAFALLATGFGAGAAIAAPWEDPLPAIPRTTAEAERIAKVTAPPTDFSKAEAFEAKPGGATTVRARTSRDAFSQPSANIGFEGELTFKVGNGLFRKIWVSAPASTRASDGLGPLYSARSCQRCHIKDGRGHAPESSDDQSVSMFLRISIPAPGDELAERIEGYIGTVPDPVYGGQLQEFGLHGHLAEYRLDVSYEETVVALSENEVATLRTPTYRALDLGYGPLDEAVMLSPRVAPQMIGLGLLEAVPAADIFANADPDDLDGDGISGRPNVIWSTEFDRPMLGRFGLKAGSPSVREQSAAAFLGDMGLSTPLNPHHWGDCTVAQVDCRLAPHGNHEAEDGFEVSAASLDLVTFYSRNLAVPARRDVNDAEVLRGKTVFFEAGCAGCHTPKFVTNRLVGGGAQSFQLIWPYSDLLLHDMGDGLADHRPEARATGREWRTPPLWGIGLTEQVSGHTQFLHDGRARNLLEAILWHGGEGAMAQDRVISMPKADRSALIRFLESL